MKLFNYWGFVGSLTEIEDYVRIFDNNFWNGEPVPFEADVYGLIDGRHEMPVKRFILKNITFGPTSYHDMEEEAIKVLASQKTNNAIIVYVTGYTPATIAAINVAKSVGYTQIILKHHDKDSGLYLDQWVY
jgi:hypothetical protein